MTHKIEFIVKENESRRAHKYVSTMEFLCINKPIMWKSFNMEHTKTCINGCNELSLNSFTTLPQREIQTIECASNLKYLQMKR